MRESFPIPFRWTRERFGSMKANGHPHQDKKGSTYGTPSNKIEKSNHSSEIITVDDDGWKMINIGHQNLEKLLSINLLPRFVSGRLLLPMSGRSRGAATENVVARALPEATLLLADLEPTPTVRENSDRRWGDFFLEFSRLLVFFFDWGKTW